MDEHTAKKITKIWEAIDKLSDRIDKLEDRFPIPLELELSKEELNRRTEWLKGGKLCQNH